MKKTNMAISDHHWDLVTLGSLWAVLWSGNLPLSRWHNDRPE